MNEKLKAMKLIHFAISAGLVLAYIFIGDLTSMDNLKIPILDTSFLIYLTIPVGAIFLGDYLYKLQIQKSDASTPLEQKMTTYQTASIIRLAILEAAAFVLLIIRPDFVLIGICLIVYVILLYPTEDKFKRAFE